MRAALYARVSTRDQHPENQLTRVRAWAAASGYAPTEFVDHGRSGRNTSREGMRALQDTVRRREVDVIVCTKLDRLARSMKQLCDLSAAFDAAGVDLVVLDQAVDTRTPAGKLVFGVLAAVAEFESDLISDRTVDGMERARRAGKHLGRPAALDHSGIARARRLRRAGRSVREVARMLGVSRSVIQRATAEDRAHRNTPSQTTDTSSRVATAR